MHPVAKRLFIVVTLVFAVVIAAWTALIIVAERHKPEMIPVPSPHRTLR
ncbi:MAG TPA: hypothetical protein VGA56_06060 [Opitutaceae bacterium]